MEPIIRGVGLRLERGAACVLRESDFAWRSPLTGLIGANGSGKSTLLQALAGLVIPAAGRVRTEETDGEASKVDTALPFYVPDRESALPDETSVLQAIEGAAALAGLTGDQVRARAQAACDRLGLGEARFQRYANLSEGYRQRARLACALAAGARHVLLDEPYLGLDRGAVESLSSLVRSLAASGVRFVIASHDPAPLALLKAELWVLEGGRLRAVSAALRAHAKGPRFTARFGDMLRAKRVLVEAGWNAADPLDVLELEPPEDVEVPSLVAALRALERLGLVPTTLAYAA